ncbi:SusD/RagB family nutrient-binding outer membrane lipoprotein [candidate division KSB1 bacterium]|nr:SusD/RagB family nutrient-binding outer membrane lipoprotein [candidate division KSB1 bacterium]
MILKKLLSLVLILLLAGFMVGCDKFLEGGILDSDPNRATDAPLLSLLASTQMVTNGFVEGDIGIFASLWMQHVAGVQQQYNSFEVYEITAEQFDGAWGQVYMEGGLIDMNEIEARATENKLRTVAGIAKMCEALVVATAADVWGDMPYAQAAQPSKYPAPKYDKQSAVHDAVLALIDEAIADFVAGQEYFDGSYDFAFGGDVGKWIEAAHTLKARILLNWAKAKPGNYALALAEAQQGISSTDGNWQAYHSVAVGEENLFVQFKRDYGYIRVAANIVEMFKANNDPRLGFYFEPNSAGEYVGSANAEYNESAIWMNPETFGNAAWHYDMVTWEENQFIIAECQYNSSNEGGALTTLNATLTGIETRWADYLGGVSIPKYTGISGNDVLKAIMNEKYKALFLNPQIWTDWKRTGYPELTTAGNREVPRRFLYPADEANTNTNFPGVLGLYHRNENDPN